MKALELRRIIFYFENKIAEAQSLADKTKNMGEHEASEELLKEKKRLHEKLKRRFRHLYRNFASHLIKELHGLGVSTIYLGYPFEIALEKGNKFTVNVWSYRKFMNTIELKAQEYGMKVLEVVEYDTSKYCAYHDVEVERNPRGVVSCPKGHRLHSDHNGSLNILKKAVNVIVSKIKKPISFIVDHSRVAPVKGCNP
ncbi:MAG: zinc ribbon domain-containing protein [Nitrososphaeria archaeon]